MDPGLIDRFSTARVARLASVDHHGRPHVVPITFASDRRSIVFAVDSKPKRSTRLKRLDNLRIHPDASVLVDHYDDDWSRLWWVRADGAARLIEPDDRRHGAAVARLVAKYPQYRKAPPSGTAVLIAVERWSGWRSADS